jgi:hypothetical protein
MESAMKTLVGLALFVATARAASAQADPDSVHHRNECRQAAQVVRTGEPHARLTRSLLELRDCGAEGGRVLATAFKARQATATRAELDALTRPASYLRDAALFEAGIDVAADPTAKPDSRVFAFRIVLATVMPGLYPSYEELTGGGSQNMSCFGARFGLEGGLSDGAPLPPDAVSRAYDLSFRTLRDSSTPAPVKQAAICTYFAARYEMRRQSPGGATAQPKPL